MRLVSTTAFAAALSIAATASSAQDRTYDLAGFDRVEGSAGVIANVTVGPDFSVSATVEEGDIDRLEVDLLSGTLSISRKSSWSLFSSNTDRFIVTVTMPTITGMETSSGATLNILGAVTSELEADAASGSTLNIEAGEFSVVDLEASSGATLRVSGNCVDLKAETSSGSTIAAEDLKCATGSLEASSGSTLRSFVTKSAAIEASSGASVVVTGGAEISSRESSSGGSIRSN